MANPGCEHWAASEEGLQGICEVLLNIPFSIIVMFQGDPHSVDI
jgi:hypothetical protein